MISTHVYSAFLIGAPDVELSLRGGQITLDDTAAPHVQGGIEIAWPGHWEIVPDDLPTAYGGLVWVLDDEVLDALDPKLTPRVRVEVDGQYPSFSQHREFDLGVRSRNPDQVSRVVALELASDEALLDDARALEDDDSPFALAASLRDVVDYILGEAITLRRNLFLNPWPLYVHGGLILNGELSAAADGDGFYRITHTNGATAGGDYVLIPMGDLEVGETYAVRVNLFAITGVVSVSATIRDGFTVVAPLTQTPGPGFIVLEGTFTVTEPMAQPRVLVDFLGPGTGEACSIAQCIAEPGVSVAGAYFDGGTSPATGTKWDGTPYASPSRQTAYLAATPALDADVTPYWRVSNLVKNPVCHASTAGWFPASGNSTITRSGTGGPFAEPHGIATAVGTGGVGAIYSGGASALASSMRVTPGEKVTGNMYLRASVAGKTARVVIRFTDGTSFYDVGTVNTAITNTGWTRVSVTSEVPAGFNTAVIYCVADAPSFTAGQALYFAAAMLHEGTRVVPFFVPGYTPATPQYTYVWEGTAHDSASTRVPSVERDPDSLTWRAGQRAIEFLAPLVQAHGYRLVCDESRTWTLRDENYVAEGSLNISYGANMIDGSDSIDRDAGYWYDAQVTRYRDRVTSREWIDSFALNDPPTLVNLVEVEGAYPGPGRSEYAVRRAQGRGREVTASAVARWTERAEQPITVTLDGAAIQYGKTSRVTFTLGPGDTRDRVSVTTRTTDIDPDAWLLGDDTTDWMTGDLVETWL